MKLINYIGKFFCKIGIHSWKVIDSKVTVYDNEKTIFIIKEHCKCKHCPKETIFIYDSDYQNMEFSTIAGYENIPEGSYVIS